MKCHMSRKDHVHILFAFVSMCVVGKKTKTPIATSVIRKVCGRLCFLYRQGHFLNERSRRTLCTALLQCHFDYCCSSWFSSLSTKLKNKLQAGASPDRFLWGGVRVNFADKPHVFADN